jgi:hypothetical protein
LRASSWSAPPATIAKSPALLALPLILAQGLESLASQWFQISGTITYVTTRYGAGEAASFHQCLRQSRT